MHPYAYIYIYIQIFITKQEELYKPKCKPLISSKPILNLSFSGLVAIKISAKLIIIIYFKCMTHIYEYNIERSAQNWSSATHILCSIYVQFNTHRRALVHKTFAQ